VSQDVIAFDTPQRKRSVSDEGTTRAPSDCQMLHAGFLIGLFFDAEGADVTFLQSVG
jgi:hypothetical protein